VTAQSLVIHRDYQRAGVRVGDHERAPVPVEHEAAGTCTGVRQASVTDRHGTERQRQTEPLPGGGGLDHDLGAVADKDEIGLRQATRAGQTVEAPSGRLDVVRNGEALGRHAARARRPRPLRRPLAVSSRRA